MYYTGTDRISNMGTWIGTSSCSYRPLGPGEEGVLQGTACIPAREGASIDVRMVQYPYSLRTHAHTHTHTHAHTHTYHTHTHKTHTRTHTRHTHTHTHAHKTHTHTHIPHTHHTAYIKLLRTTNVKANRAKPIEHYVGHKLAYTNIHTLISHSHKWPK